jgi:hypothetical protein
MHFAGWTGTVFEAYSMSDAAYERVVLSKWHVCLVYFPWKDGCQRSFCFQTGQTLCVRHFTLATTSGRYVWLWARLFPTELTTQGP